MPFINNDQFCCPYLKRILPFASALLILFTSRIAPATQPPQASPAKSSSTAIECKIGVYVLEIYDIQTNQNSFVADFWIWSVCPNKEIDAVRNADYINSLDSPESDPQTYQSTAGFYSSQRIHIPFHHNWDIRYFPFDSPKLQIHVEDSINDLDHLVYKADVENSGIGQVGYLGDWSVVDFSVGSSSTYYPTTYGDPGLTEGRTYSRFTINVQLKRNGFSLFLRMVSGVFASIIIALMAFFLDSRYETLHNGQFGLLVGALFGILVNQRSTDSTLGNLTTITLVDYIHLISLVYVILIGISVIRTRYVTINMPEVEIPHPNMKRFFTFGGSYLIITMILVLGAYFLAQ